MRANHDALLVMHPDMRADQAIVDNAAVRFIADKENLSPQLSRFFLKQLPKLTNYILAVDDTGRIVGGIYHHRPGFRPNGRLQDIKPG